MHPRRAGFAAAVGTLTVLIMAGCGTATPSPAPTNRPVLTTAAPSESSTPPGAPARTGDAPDAQAADPVRVRIPGIGVNAAVDPLDLDANRVLPPPATNERTGWWRSGPEPGERGPAVIVGHVDSYRGPAVFFRLRELRPGSQILVDRADGTTAVFAVERIEQHGKDTFPTQAVYAETPQPQLRLITCGGDFDHANRRYLDNVIAFAVLVSA